MWGGGKGVRFSQPCQCDLGCNHAHPKASCPGLIRASMMTRRRAKIYVGPTSLRLIMDCRVKPGNDS